MAIDDVKHIILVGEDAKAHEFICPHTNMLFRMKDLVGRRYDDPQTQKLKSIVKFEIDQDADGNALIKVGTEHFSPTVVCGYMLDKMKKTAELYLRRTISNALISVPYDFTLSQRKAIELAGNSVGLDVIHLIEEPVAALLASKRKHDGVVVIFSMGSGRFDVSVLEMKDRVIKVLAGLSSNMSCKYIILLFCLFFSHWS